MKQKDLLLQLNLDLDLSLCKDIECIYPKLNKNNQTLLVFLSFYDCLSFNSYKQIKQSLKEKLGLNIELFIQTDKQDNALYVYREYLNYFISYYSKFSFLKNAHSSLLKNTLSIKLSSSVLVEELNLVKDDLMMEFSRVGIDITIESELIENKPVESIPAFIDRTDIKPVEKKVTFNKATKDVYLVTINDLVDEVYNVCFIGHIFKINERITTTGKSVELTYSVFDGENAITATLFSRINKEKIGSVGDKVKISGDYVFDTFLKRNSFKISKIEILLDDQIIEDTASIKRSEFHAHTKASEMDGISDVKELLETAHRFGFDAIAITDHAVLHNFPAAQRIANTINKNNTHQIKVVYGCEMNMVNDELIIITGQNNNDTISSKTTVIFDLETTGLSSESHEIIEFGAVKMIDGVVVDQKQLFIKPQKPIPTSITAITNITNEMVENSPTLEECIDEITEFIGDSVLVAHNAVFDISFLRQAYKKCHKAELNNHVIDTLPLSRCLLENRKNFTLGGVARYFKIAYEQSIAHRADYDAQILQLVYVQLLKLLEEKNVITVKDLYNFQKQQVVHDKLREYHVNVLVKNQEGVKALYELVSLSHTKYLMYRGKSSKKEDESLAQPRILRKEIERLRKNLLIGSACFNSYLFEIARTGSYDQLLEEIAFYDFIELQPLENYSPLIYRKQFDTIDDVIDLLNKIIKAALQLNKLIVATGDVHYVYQQQKIFREIYINAMGIGGAKHPLYIYDNNVRSKQLSPNQHLRTTQEMLSGYPYLDTDFVYEIVVNNTKKLNEMIDEVYPIGKDLFPPKIDNSDELLRNLCFENARSIYGDPLPKIVEDRLNFELESIIGNGYGVVYYTSHLLVNKSNKDGYLVGSRGSVGSSFAATMAKITEVNPLVPHYVCPKCKHSEFFMNNEADSGFDLPNKNCPRCNTKMNGDGQDIPFETFLGFEGDKVPDIDLNFSSDYQEIAHAYTKELFGEDKVLRAGTIGTIAEKTAYGLVSGYFESIGDLKEKNQAYRDYLALNSSGVKRSTGQHPGGIVVVPNDKDILDFVPYQYPANNPEASWLTTHFEYHDIESNLLKLDILGHVDPTSMKFLQEVSGIDVTQIDMNDQETLSLFSSTLALNIDETSYNEENGALGLPEFGTNFVRRMLNDTKPKTFSQLVKISGLSHGTDVWNNNAADLIKQDLTLSDVICCRDDIMTYLMMKGLPSKAAFLIMESVRKGKGLKENEIALMKEKGISDWYIDSAQKIKYLFPKAHAVAYCMMGFRVAWFKVHKPLAFYAQYFTLRCDAYEIKTMMDGYEALVKRLGEIKTKIMTKVASKKEEQLANTFEVAIEFHLRGFSFTPLNIDTGMDIKFWPNPEIANQLLVPFNVVDSLGNAVAINIVNERKNKPFLSKEDFKKRTQINQTALKELEKINALNDLNESNQISFF